MAIHVTRKIDGAPLLLLDDEITRVESATQGGSSVTLKTGALVTVVEAPSHPVWGTALGGWRSSR